MKKPINILLFFPVWHRRDILRICLEGVKRLIDYNSKQYKILPFAVVSDKADADLLSEYNIPYIEYSNDFLGRKKNAGLAEALKRFDFDYLLEIDSDDLLSNNLLDHYLPFMEKAVPAFGPNQCSGIDMSNGEVGFVKTKLIIGAGRMIHREVLEKMMHVPFTFEVSAAGPSFEAFPGKIEYMTKTSADHYQDLEFGKITGKSIFNLWDNEKQRGMDTCSVHNLKKIGVDHQLIEVPADWIVDLKDETNINHIRQFSPSELRPEQVLKNFGSTERKLAKQLLNPSLIQPQKATVKASRTKQNKTKTK